MRLILILILCFYGRSVWTQDQQVSAGFLFNGEPYIAQNPLDPQHLVVAWMGTEIENLEAKITIHTRTSFNSGQTWSDIVLIPHVLSEFGSADPSVEFDGDGNVYLTYIDYSSEIEEGGIYVRKSIDGGLNWLQPVLALDMHADVVQYPVDRPWMVIDLSNGEGSGNIYITSTNPKTFGDVQPPYHPYLVMSDDGGSTFSAWQYLDGPDWLAGDEISQPMAAPAVGPDGTFHAVYPSYVSLQNLLPQFVHVYSENQGSDFQYQQVYDGIPGESDPFAKKGYRLQADPSDPDHLVFLNFGVPEGDMDLYLYETFDAGNTWTDAYRVNDDPVGNGALQDLVWCDFDDDGDMVIMWRDRRNAGISGYSAPTEIFGVTRPAGGSFGLNFQVSSSAAPHTNILLEAGNDFMCVKMYDDTLYAVWGDTRSSVLHIWFQRMTINGEVVSVQDIAGRDTLSLNLFPNPAGDNLILESKGIEGYEIMDTMGRIVRNETMNATDRLELDISALVTGQYYLRVIHQNGTSVLPFNHH